MRKGGWRPGQPADISGVILAILAVQAINRGVDYLLGDKATTTESLTVVEQAMPLWIWGALFITGGLLVCVGMWARRAEPIIVGGVVLMATYSAMAWGLMLKMIERGTSLHAFFDAAGTGDLSAIVAAWPWDGWRTPTSFIVMATLWGCLAWGTRIMERARGDTHGGAAGDAA